MPCVSQSYVVYMPIFWLQPVVCIFQKIDIYITHDNFFTALLNIPPESTFITKAATQQVNAKKKRRKIMMMYQLFQRKAALLLTQCISIMVLFILFILSYMGILRSSFTHHKLICTYLCICCLIFLIRIGLAGFSGKESKLGKDGQYLIL